MWPFSIHVITFVFAFDGLFACIAAFGTFPTELQSEYGICIWFNLSHYTDGIKISPYFGNIFMLLDVGDFFFA